VIRGHDLLASTAGQVILPRFRRAPPAFAHVTQILGLDKARLSTRHGATRCSPTGRWGTFPTRWSIIWLAWVVNGDQELFRREELITHFTLENVGKSGRES